MRGWSKYSFVIALCNINSKIILVRIFVVFIIFVGNNLLFGVVDYCKTILVCFSLSNYVVQRIVSFLAAFVKNVNICIGHRLVCRKTANHYNCAVNSHTSCNSKVCYLNSQNVFVAFCNFFAIPVINILVLSVCIKAHKSVAVVQIFIKVNFFKVALVLYIIIYKNLRIIAEHYVFCVCIKRIFNCPDFVKRRIKNVLMFVNNFVRILCFEHAGTVIKIIYVCFYRTCFEKIIIGIITVAVNLSVNIFKT